MKPTPHYKIIHDKVKGDYIIQTYINSVAGWSYVKAVPTLKEAEEWILSGVIKKQEGKP